MARWLPMFPLGTVLLSFAADPQRASFELAACAPIGPLDAFAVLAAADTSGRYGLLESLPADRAAELRARLAQET
ncbi:MAG: hypothetical protein ACT4OX_14500 [Actinomycetota bacterium]